jgi:hypothetical protein
MTVYGCGLRISEMTQLNPSDINRACITRADFSAALRQRCAEKGRLGNPTPRSFLRFPFGPMTFLYILQNALKPVDGQLYVFVTLLKIFLNSACSSVVEQQSDNLQVGVKSPTRPLIVRSSPCVPLS